MDFTYPFAFVIGLALSAVASLALVITVKQIPRKLRRYLVLTIAGFVLIVSINWHFLGELPLWFWIFDFLVIFGMGSLGAFLGTLLLRLRPKAPP